MSQPPNQQWPTQMYEHSSLAGSQEQLQGLQLEDRVYFTGGRHGEVLVSATLKQQRYDLIVQIAQALSRLGWVHPRIQPHCAHATGNTDKLFVDFGASLPCHQHHAKCWFHRVEIDLEEGETDLELERGGVSDEAHGKQEEHLDDKDPVGSGMDLEEENEDEDGEEAEEAEEEEEEENEDEDGEEAEEEEAEEAEEEEEEAEESEEEEDDEEEEEDEEEEAIEVLLRNWTLAQSQEGPSRQLCVTLMNTNTRPSGRSGPSTAAMRKAMKNEISQLEDNPTVDRILVADVHLGQKPLWAFVHNVLRDIETRLTGRARLFVWRCDDIQAACLMDPYVHVRRLSKQHQTQCHELLQSSAIPWIDADDPMLALHTNLASNCRTETLVQIFDRRWPAMGTQNSIRRIGRPVEFVETKSTQHVRVTEMYTKSTHHKNLV